MRICARLATAAALLLAACGTGGGGGDIAVIVAGPQPETGESISVLAESAAQATLIDRNSQGLAVPGLASSWRFVDDGRALILRLKPVRWSDGSLLVADDVVASFRRLAAADRGSARLAMQTIDKGAEVAAGDLPPSRLGVMAPTSRVVEIRLAAAMPTLLDWLAQPEFAIVRAGKPPLALGDYTETRRNDETVLHRIAEAASDTAQSAKITVTATADIAAAVQAFAAGKADVVIGSGLEGLDTVPDLARAATVRTETVWATYGYLANTRYGPAADVRVRRALAMTVDRDALTGHFGRAGVTPLTGLVPPVLAAGTPYSPDWAALDMPGREAAARKLLLEAGFGEVRALRLTLLVPAGKVHRALAALVAQAWGRIGVLVSVTEADPKAMAVALGHGRYDLVLVERQTPVADRAVFLRSLRCTPLGYCNRDADALVASAATLPPAAASAALNQAETLMAADVPVIPLLVPVHWALVGAHVTGWVPNPAGAHPLGRLVANGARSP